MKSKSDEMVYMFYARYHLQLPDNLTFGRYNYMNAYKPRVTITKEFYDKCGSTNELSRMIDYMVEEGIINNVTIIVWSVFDLNIADYHSLSQNFKIISLLEDESSVDIYDKMVCKFYQLEEACIADPLGDFWQMS